MKNQGFTLIELLVAIAVLAIMATIAIPSFSQFIKYQQLAAAKYDAHYLLSSARQEAITRRLDVTVMLGGSGGWPIKVVYTDPSSGSEMLVTEREVADSSISVEWSEGKDLIFNKYGRVNNAKIMCIIQDGVVREIQVYLSGLIMDVPEEEDVACGG